MIASYMPHVSPILALYQPRSSPAPEQGLARGPRRWLRPPPGEPSAQRCGGRRMTILHLNTPSQTFPTYPITSTKMSKVLGQSVRRLARDADDQSMLRERPWLHVRDTQGYTESEALS